MNRRAWRGFGDRIVPWTRRCLIGIGLLCPLSVASTQTIRLASPRAGARPHSAYVVVEGEAAAFVGIEVLEDGVRAATIQADSRGRFERVIRLNAGHHEIRVRAGNEAAGADCNISPYPAANPGSPYEQLQTGDVILAHDRDSQQDALYHPIYTHTALYIGPDREGAALLLEAVSEDEAGPRGPVAAAPIEESLVWRGADRVDAFRLQGGLTSEDRARIVAWARLTAGRGLPFLATGDFGDIYRAWLLWDQHSDRPRDAVEFQSILDGLRQRLQASDAYDCATLVWHAYRDNTAEHIDLASPNRINGGGAMGQVSKGLLTALLPLLILPDSFAMSGKLRRVTGE